MSRKEIGTGWDRNNRNAINDNFEELYNVQDRAIKEATEAVINDSKLIWKEPVSTYNDIATTYPTPQNGWAVMARDTGKVFRFYDGFWTEIQQIDVGPVNELDSRLTSQLAQTTQEVETVKTNKADKTYTDSQLNLKRDKSVKITNNDLDTSTDEKKIKLVNLSDEVQQALTGNAPALSTISDGAVGTTKLADGALKRAKAGTSLGSMSDIFVFTNKNYVLTRSGTDLVLKFETGISGYYRSVESNVNITLPSPTEFTIPTAYALVFDINNTSTFFVKSIGSLTVNDVVLLVNMGGFDVVNNIRKTQGKFNEVLFTNADVRWRKGAYPSFEITVTFSGDKRIFLKNGDTVNKQISIPLDSYTFDRYNVLVWNLYKNSIEVKSWDAITPDDIVLFGNANGLIIQNNINAIKGSGLSTLGESTVLYYGGFVRLENKGYDITVNFSRDGDTRLFYKREEGNGVLQLSPNFKYLVPHNQSLVLNRTTDKLEIINTDNIIHDVHWTILSNHAGIPKKIGIRVENDIQNNDYRNARIPVSVKEFPVNQDGCIVGEEVWMFDESNSEHTNTANIHRLSKTTFEEIGTITHNLGHANGADYRNGKLLVFNGGGYPPEINLYSNPIGKSSLMVADAGNVQIIFSEGTKTLEGDGSACFGENERIVYYVGYNAIYKILLGMGDNDLSDKTVDKSDTTKWGTFISGKLTTEYNGTAQIINTYVGHLGQPQGVAYDGFLYVSTNYSNIHAWKVELNDKAGVYRIVDDYWYNYTDYKNTLIGLEPESVFFIGQQIYIGARSPGISLIVGLEK